jgi:uncharacterized protein (DUF1499 family)
MIKTARYLIGMLAGWSALAGCAGDKPNYLGVRNGRLVNCPASPNCVSSQAEDEQHRIAPLAFTGNMAAAFARLKKVLGKRADAVLVEEREGYLRVELHTTLFTDDAEFLLDPEHSAIQVRSASRLGHSDLGKNRSRMEDIRKDFNAGQ